MTVIGIIVMGIIIFFAYRLGHSDGVLSEKTQESFRRLEGMIKQLKKGGTE